MHFTGILATKLNLTFINRHTNIERDHKFTYYYNGDEEILLSYTLNYEQVVTSILGVRLH